MSWAIGEHNGRDIGYGVPAICDHPNCNNDIDRGLSYVCGGEPYGGEHGCGLFFCGEHLFYHQFRGEETVIQTCKRCDTYKPPYSPKPDTQEWVNWKLTDESWAQWREENPEIVESLRNDEVNNDT